MAKEKEKETTVDVSKEIKTFGFTYSFQNGISVRIPIGIKNDDEKLKIHYDDIVDRSQFRPDSENVRLFRLSGQGSEGTPVYDSDENTPTNLEVQIRSGKFDKAEISQMQQKKQKDIQNEIITR